MATAVACSPSQSSSPSPSIWEEIDLSESYLVCCMFEEAASSASSIIHRTRAATGTAYGEETLEQTQLLDIMESAGMVFVQAFKELGRTSKIFTELEALYGLVPAIPGQVLLTGACIQIAGGHGTMLRPILEQFFRAWKFVDGHAYVSFDHETYQSFSDGTRRPLLSLENYLEIIDVYIVQLLGMVLHDIDFAISWTEKADLPQEKRQELLRRLHSLHSAKDSSTYNAPQPKNKTSNSSRVEVIQEPLNGQNHPIESSYKFSISTAIRPCMWLFDTFHLKCGNSSMFHHHGKIMFWSTLIFLICYILRKKRAGMQWMAVRHAHSIRKVLVDFWQLAFSVQVNPLAAVQPLPSSSHGIR